MVYCICRGRNPTSVSALGVLPTRYLSSVVEHVFLNAKAQVRFLQVAKICGSSMVEHLTVNQQVVGSSPTRRAKEKTTIAGGLLSRSCRYIKWSKGWCTRAYVIPHTLLPVTCAPLKRPLFLSGILSTARHNVNDLLPLPHQ